MARISEPMSQLTARPPAALRASEQYAGSLNQVVWIVSLLSACAGQARRPEVSAPAQPRMDLAALGLALAELDPAVSGPVGAWELEYQGVKLTCLAQENVDRMRIFAPIAKLEDVSDPQLAKALEANFQGALDA